MERGETPRRNRVRSGITLVILGLLGASTSVVPLCYIGLASLISGLYILLRKKPPVESGPSV